MKRHIAIFIIMYTSVVFSNGPLAAESPPINQEVSSFVGFTNLITDFFNHLSATYDKIVKKEEREQLIARVKDIVTELDKLATTRQGFIGTLLDTKKPTLTKEEKKELLSRYNQATNAFKYEIMRVNDKLSKLLPDMTTRGAEGREVEQIIRLAVDSGYQAYDSLLKEGEVKTHISRQYYGVIDDVDFNENKLLEESKRCIKALEDAQRAASQFLAHLKQEADRE